MKIIRKKLKIAKDYFRHGEIIRIAEANDMDRDRAYKIASGQLSPRLSEMPFAYDLLNLAQPRIEDLKEFNHI